MKYVIDTSSLIQNLEQIDFSNAIIPTLVLRELESKKSDKRFGMDTVNFEARQAIRTLKDNESVIEFYADQHPEFIHLDKKLYDVNYADNRYVDILLELKSKGRDVGLMTEDVFLAMIAKSYDIEVKMFEEELAPKYVGTIEKTVTEEELLEVEYMLNRHQHENIFDLKIGQYIVLLSEEGFEEKALRWNGSSYKEILMGRMIPNSKHLDAVSPMNLRQAIAIDSLSQDKMTIMTGKAGSGKSFLSVSHIMQKLDDETQKVYLVTNNQPLRGTKTFGLKKGGIKEKILQSNLGIILSTKLELYVIDDLIQKERIVLVPLEDIRGASFNGIVYVTEAQNMSIDNMKTLIERMEENSQLIIEGDERQIDDRAFSGSNNGIKRVLEVFGGTTLLGHVQLEGNFRGALSELADKM